MTLAQNRRLIRLTPLERDWDGQRPTSRLGCSHYDLFPKCLNSHVKCKKVPITLNDQGAYRFLKINLRPF